MSGYRVGIVGATGAVGREMLGVLAQRRFPVSALTLIASGRSAGSRIDGHEVVAISPGVFADLDVAMFDTPDEVAMQWVPVAADAGVTCVDNSGAFRMAPDVPLVIPEVNGDALRSIRRGIVANPNCTTVTIAVPLAPLHRAARLRRVIACSYQSVSGAGQRGVAQLWAEIDAASATHRPPEEPAGEAFAHPIAFNIIPAIGALRGAHPSEEVKVAAELRKMLAAPELPVGVTCVRVPTLTAHGVAVHVEFERPMDAAEARAILSEAAGIEVVDAPDAHRYPTARLAMGQDPCYVGRIRTDEAGGLAFFAVTDNLRKGAALNAVQIVETMISMGLLQPKVSA
ncbi:MAG TPA: aspartate-semialdehyde dehydrogenase [bacterium]|jgi:aspartate-semialdehyde dehydrogenase